MSGHVGLREDAQMGRNLARLIATLFPLPVNGMPCSASAAGVAVDGCRHPPGYRVMCRVLEPSPEQPKVID